MSAKRRTYSVSERLELRRHHQDHPRLTQAELCTWFERTFGKPISQGTVCESLSPRYADLSENNVRGKRARLAAWPALEEALRLWLVRDSGDAPISGDILKEKATLLWKQLPEYAGLEIPPWSNGWLSGFHRRAGFSSRRRLAEICSVNTPQMDADLAHVKVLVNRYDPACRFTCGETGLYYKGIPDQEFPDEASRNRAIDDGRVTIHFACNATGTVKLKPWIIGKAANPQSFRAEHVQSEHLGMQYRSSRKAAMTSTIFGEWLRWFDDQMQQPVVLVMNNLLAHAQAVQALQNLGSYGLRHVEVVFLPPTTTSQSQPLEQGIFTSFKAHWRRDWLCHKLNECENIGHAQTEFTLLQTIRLSIRAWRDVSIRTIANAWQLSSLESSDQVALHSGFPTVSGEVKTEMARNLIHLQTRKPKTKLISINQLLNPLDEQIEISTYQDPILEIVEELNPARDIDTNHADEHVEEKPMVTLQQARDSVRTLRLQLEQSEKCDSEIWNVLDQIDATLTRCRSPSKQTSVIRPPAPSTSTPSQ